MGEIGKALAAAGKEMDSLKQQLKEVKSRVAKNEMRIGEIGKEDPTEEED